MIIKSIPGGDSSNIINYICKNSTAKDKEILSGNPNLSKHIIDNSKFKQNYYHFTLSENGRTDITKEHWEVILNVFKKEFFHGYDEKEVNSLSVLHDKEHIHIAVPTMNLLSGKGNYYYNDRTDRKRINLIRDLIHKIDFTDYGLKDIKLREPSEAEEKDFTKSRLDEIIDFRKKHKRDFSDFDTSKLKDRKKIINIIQKETSKMHKAGFFANQDELYDFFNKEFSAAEEHRIGYDNKFKSDKNQGGYYISIPFKDKDTTKNIKIPIKEFNDEYYEGPGQVHKQSRGYEEIRSELDRENKKRSNYLEKRKGKTKIFENKKLNDLSSSNLNNVLDVDSSNIQEFDTTSIFDRVRTFSHKKLGDNVNTSKSIKSSELINKEDNCFDIKLSEQQLFKEKNKNILGKNMANQFLTKNLKDRIPAIKRDINIAEYLQSRGVEVKSTGIDKYICCSPIRDEKKPSFSIFFDNNKESWLWYDYSSGRAGSIIDLHMELERCSVNDAIDNLSSDNKYEDLPKVTLIDNLSTNHSMDHVVETDYIKDNRLTNYLMERGIYARPNNIIQLEEFKNINGVIKRYSYIAMKNKSNGYALRNSLFKGNKGQTNITNVDNKKNKTVIVEGMFDYMSLYQKHGNGVNYISLNSITNIKKVEFKPDQQYIIALDNDVAAINTIKEIHQSTKRDDLLVITPKYKDFNEDLVKSPSAPLEYIPKKINKFINDHNHKQTQIKQQQKMKTITKKIKKQGKTITKEVEVPDLDL